MKHEQTTDRILGAFYQVYNTLGYGFLERVYRNAMKIELEKRGSKARREAKIEVFYDGRPVGIYFADLLVDGCVIVELKVAESIAKEHEAQLLNYLKATSIDVGLILNFGPQAQFKRKVFETARRVSRPSILPSDPSSASSE